MSRRTFETEKYFVETGYDKPMCMGPIHLTIFDKEHEERTGQEKVIYDHLEKGIIKTPAQLVAILDMYGITNLPVEFIDHLREDVATQMMNGGKNYGLILQG